MFWHKSWQTTTVPQEAESRWSEREEALRREIADIETKLHMQEASFSDAIASTSEGTQPLLR